MREDADVIHGSVSAGVQVPLPSAGGVAEALGLEAARELRRLWRQGRRSPAEWILNRYPTLCDSPAAGIDVVYEEYCFRTAEGAVDIEQEFFDRFPQWGSQLRILFACHHVLQPDGTPPDFPAAGDTINGFRLIEPLGQGARGHVYLATETKLSGRRVVLKLTPLDGAEHLLLAGLQHTHIVPVYSVDDDPARNVRSLCMPYFGRATLASVLADLARIPLAERTGRHVVMAIDELNAATGNPAAVSAARQMLEQVSWVQAAAWMIACLADALQYAHERSLLHLDVKPSNVLLTADGQPMLLDFHLAREPILSDGEPPDRLGGTPGYMPPEQVAAMRSLSCGQRVEQDVDTRADIFALGAVLHDLLVGTTPAGARTGRESAWNREDMRTSRNAGFLPSRGSPESSLTLAGRADAPLTQMHTAERHRGSGLRLNPQVTVGLADIVDKCLAPAVGDRYPSAAALADDLRRHLADQPLRGVRNRSLTEQWRKWRRRRPGDLLKLGTSAAAMAGLLLVYGLANREWQHRMHHATQALIDGRRQLNAEQPDEAVRTFQRGLLLLRSVPAGHELRMQLETQQQAALCQRLVAELNQIAGQLRVLTGPDLPSGVNLETLAESCKRIWDQRRAVLLRLKPQDERAVTRDLLDLAIFLARLQRHLAADAAAGREESLRTLDQAAELPGNRLVLDVERRLCRGEPIPSIATLRAALGNAGPQDATWEHYVLGRALLSLNRLEEAERELDSARGLSPEGLWPNFCYGVCTHRLGRYSEAIAAFSVCIGADPALAAPYYNRGVCYQALGHRQLADRDFLHARRLDRTLAARIPGTENH